MNSVLRKVSVLFLSLFLASCALEPTGPYAPSTQVNGTLAGTQMNDYYYPRTAGYLYVYSNVFRSYDNGDQNAPRVVNGPNDSLYTLGFIDTTQSGDSIFAYKIKYKVLSSQTGRPKMSLHYLPASQNFVGAFIDGSQSIQGDVYALNPSTRGASVDSIMGAAAGRVRMISNDFTSGESSVWQMDTIYFGYEGDSVYTFQKNSQGQWIRSRLIFARQVYDGDSWQNAYWNTTTRFNVLNADSNISTAAGNYNVVKIGVTTSAYNLPLTEHKYFGFKGGLIKQVDSWRVTSDGSNAKLQSLTREVNVVVPDWSELP